MHFLSSLKLGILLLLGSISSCLLIARQVADPILMTVGGRPIQRSTFEYAYRKNVALPGTQRMSVEEYLPLFVNYQLKVADARAHHLDTLDTFRRDFLLYRDKLLTRALIDTASLDSLARLVYARQAELAGGKDLLTVAHILLRVPTSATVAQQQQVKQRADSLRGVLLRGGDFGKLAQQYSDDESTAQSGGRLPTISPATTVREFEDAAYALSPGELSPVVQTVFGYHLIKMIKRQPFPPFMEQRSEILHHLREEEVEEMLADRRLNTLMKEHRQTREAAMDSLLATVLKEHPHWQQLIDEYHDGLLVYEISKRTVWDAADQNQAALSAIFQANRKKYKWRSKHFKGYVISAKDRATAKAAAKLLSKGVPPGQDIRDVLRPLNRDSIVVVAAGPYIVEKGENSTIDHCAFGDRKAVCLPVAPEFPVTVSVGRRLRRPEHYEDVRSEVINDLRTQLENEWLRRLSSRYPVKIYSTVLSTINRNP